MLTHPTLDQLHQLGLLGMAKAFADCRDVRPGRRAYPSRMALSCSTAR